VTRRFAHLTPTGPKPRVLLVDNHRQFLDAVSAMLADDFDGAATDGRHALDVAFVLSLATLHQLANGGGMHAMHLRHDPESFMDDVASFFDLALRRGDATCIIATADVRHGVHERLRALGWDVGGSSGHKRHAVVDAADALKSFMRNGLPDPNRLEEIAEEPDEYRRAAAEETTTRLTIFGDMVEVLSGEGRPFLTLCGYATSCFHDGVPDLWPDVCHAHRALSHADDV
jgi:hypothetical protein